MTDFFFNTDKFGHTDEQRGRELATPGSLILQICRSEEE